MAYIDDVPPVWNAYRLYESARSATADTRLLLLGDSKMSPEATGCPLGHGICRTWNVGQWSFIAPRARYQGGSGWLSFGFQPTSYSSGCTNRDPGATFTGGQSKLFPCNAVDYPFSGDAPTLSGTPFSQCVLTDQANFASGASPFGSVQVTSRLTYYGGTGMLSGCRVRSYRNANTDASPTYTQINETTLNMTTLSGLQYLDVDCGTGANPPGIGVVERGAALVETGMNMYLGPPVFYRGTPGSRTTGFGFAHISTGGHKTTDVYAVLGGGASETCTDANVQWYLQNVCFTPNFVLLDIGQNLNSGDETNELNAGTSATFRANYNLILDQLATIYSGISGAAQPYVILVNPTRSGYTDTHAEAKGRCIFQIAQERGCGFLDMMQLMPSNETGNGWWTKSADDVHYTGPTVPNYTGDGNGGECVAAAMWGGMAGESRGRQLASAVRARVR